MNQDDLPFLHNDRYYRGTFHQVMVKIAVREGRLEDLLRCNNVWVKTLRKLSPRRHKAWKAKIREEQRMSWEIRTRRACNVNELAALDDLVNTIAGPRPKDAGYSVPEGVRDWHWTVSIIDIAQEQVRMLRNAGFQAEFREASQDKSPNDSTDA